MDTKIADIYWIVPISSRFEKFRKIEQDKISKYGYCNTIRFGTVLGRNTAFLIQNMCPATRKCVQNLSWTWTTTPIKYYYFQTVRNKKTDSPKKLCQAWADCPNCFSPYMLRNGIIADINRCSLFLWTTPQIFNIILSLISILYWFHPYCSSPEFSQQTCK